MKLSITTADLESLHVDRDGIAHHPPWEGFDVYLGGLHIWFENELDALKVAEEIVKRMGGQCVRTPRAERPMSDVAE